MTIKFHHGKGILLVCLCYILVSPVNQILPVSLNRVLTLLFICMEFAFAFLVEKKAQAACLLYLIYWFAVGFFSCVNGPVLSENLSDMVYIIHVVLALELSLQTETMEEILDYVQRNRKVVLAFLFLTVLLIGISALDTDAFEENHAFRGYMYNSHAMASTAILIMVTAQLCVDAHGATLKQIACPETLLMIVGMIIVLKTKGRTFLVPAAVLLWRYFHMLPLAKTQRNVMAVVGCILFGFVLQEAISEKFIEALNNPYAKNTLAAITNFRSELWMCDLTYFTEQSFVTMLFGNGFSFVRQLHEIRLGKRLWSHNDLTYLLLASGMTGLVVYASMYIRVAKGFCRGRADWICFFAMVLFPMLANGFFIYIPLIWAFLLQRTSLYAREKVGEGG